MTDRVHHSSRFVPVLDRDDLVRDTRTGAILSRSTPGYTAARARREITRQNAQNQKATQNTVIQLQGELQKIQQIAKELKLELLRQREGLTT